MLRELPMSGFPPDGESQVTLANWQEPPHNRWSYQHLREVIPTQRIPRGAGGSSDLTLRAEGTLDQVEVVRLGERTSTFAEVLAQTWTDAVVVVHDGQLVYERYANHMAPETPHL